MDACPFSIFPIIKEISVDKVPYILGSKGNKKTVEEKGGERAKKRRNRRRDKDYLQMAKVASLQTSQNHINRVHEIGEGVGRS